MALLGPSLMLGLLLLPLPCLAMSSSSQVSILDTQAMTDQPQCSETCSNSSACDRYVFWKDTCFLLSCVNVSNCNDVPMDSLLTEEELNRGVHGNNGTAAVAPGLPDPGTNPIPGAPTELNPELAQPNSSSSGITLNSNGSAALNNATGEQSPSSSSLNQTISTSPGSESSGGTSRPAGGALPHPNSSSDSALSPQPASPIQQPSPANASTANTALDPSHQPAAQSPATVPSVEPQPATSSVPVGTNQTAPAGPAMTSASTSSPIAAARTTAAAPATTTATTTTTTTASAMSVKTIAPTTTAPLATTAITTSTTSPKAKAPVMTTPIPATTTTAAAAATTSTTTIAIPTTSTTTTATTTTSTAPEAPPVTEQKPSTSALPEALSPTANPKLPPAPTTSAGAKMEDAAGPRESIIEVAGAPLAKQLVDTAGLWAVLLFGLLFFLVTVALFTRQAYESYRRKDYTQVDYLINGMYTDSGV